MPPAISDDESSDVDAHLPVASWREDDDSSESRPNRRSASAKAPLVERADAEDEDTKMDGDNNAAAVQKVEDEDDDDDDDEDDEGDEDVYIVEAIKKHIVDEDGTLKFLVKWEGYEKKSDMTWEPEENLQESASEVLQEYYSAIGGRDNVFKQTETAARGKKRGRKSSAAVGEDGTGGSADVTPMKRSRRSNGAGRHPGHSTPPASSKPWSPPAGSWEDEIESIDACQDEGSGQLMVYLVWKNGKKTRHQTAIIYKKCPQKMLQFYEKHIKIVRADDDL